jgi:hypothetical protein
LKGGKEVAVIKMRAKDYSGYLIIGKIDSVNRKVRTMVQECANVQEADNIAWYPDLAPLYYYVFRRLHKS